MNLQNINTTFYSEIRSIIIDVLKQAARSVDYERVKMYWYLYEMFFL